MQRFGVEGQALCLPESPEVLHLTAEIQIQFGNQQTILAARQTLQGINHIQKFAWIKESGIITLTGVLEPSGAATYDEP